MSNVVELSEVPGLGDTLVEGITQLALETERTRFFITLQQIRAMHEVLQKTNVSQLEIFNFIKTLQLKLFEKSVWPVDFDIISTDSRINFRVRKRNAA